MSNRWPVLPALALAFVSMSAAAAGARSSALKINVTGVQSIAGAAKAAPATLALDADSTRDADRERKHSAMLQKFASDRRANASPALKAAAAARSLPRVSGFRVSDDDESAFTFAGLSNVDQANVNLGFSVEPPDQALCVGNGFVFEGVNDAFAVYSEGGKLLAGPAQANAFMATDFSLNVSDPKCLYDAATDRWFVTMTEYNNSFSDNHIKIAVSQSGDPTGSFIIYDINVTNDGSDFFPGDCPCLGDQPLIGADASGFYVSTNAFGFFSFQGAQIYAISKAALAQGSASPPAVHFDQLSFLLPDVEFSFSVQPASTPPGAKFAPGTEYLAQSMGAFKLENRLAVYSLSNTAAIDSDPGKMSIAVAVTPSQVYVQPVPASQKAGPTPRAEIAAINDFNFGGNVQNLDGNDQRLSQLTYASGRLWTSVGTALVSDGNPVHDGAAWFVLDVSNPPSGPTASVAAQGYVAAASGAHLIYPALSVNAGGEAAMVFTLTGPQDFPSAAYWKFGAKSLHVLADGEGTQDGFSAYVVNRPRWGDYSAAAVGPDGSIWMATEMIPGGFRKRSANWGTTIGHSHRGDDD